MKRTVILLLSLIFCFKLYAQNSKFIVSGELIPLFNSILDDFNDLNSLNNWRLFTYAGGDGGAGTCVNSYSTNSGWDNGYLKLDYNISSSGSYSWYASRLGSQNLSSSNFNALMFMVKGNTGGEYFKITLKTEECNASNRISASVYINDFLNSGVTGSWQKVLIPLKNFSNITNFSEMKEFSFAFENTYSSSIGAPLSGTIYIDNIKFTNSPTVSNTLIIDYFNDKNKFNSLGTITELYTGGGATGNFKYTDASGTFTNAAYGLELDYTNINVPSYPSGWIVVVFRFGGGNDFKTSLPVNISNYSNITFYAKNKENKNNPKQLQINIKDYDGASQAVYTSESSGGNNPLLNTNWQKITVPLVNFSNVNLTRVSQLEFAINQWCSDITNTGTVFIDQIQLEK